MSFVVGRVRRRCRVPSIDVLRHDGCDGRQRVADELERRRLGELKTAVCSSGVSTASRFLKTSAAEILQRLPDVQRREGDVGRGEWLAVVPGHAFAQLEGDGQSVGRAFPARREPRRKPVLAFDRKLRPAARSPCSRRRTRRSRRRSAGLRFFGSESAATTRRPPFFGVCAQPIVGRAVEARRMDEPTRSPRREIVKPDIFNSILTARPDRPGLSWSRDYGYSPMD